MEDVCLMFPAHPAANTAFQGLTRVQQAPALSVLQTAPLALFLAAKSALKVSIKMQALVFLAILHVLSALMEVSARSALKAMYSKLPK